MHNLNIEHLRKFWRTFFQMPTAEAVAIYFDLMKIHISVLIRFNTVVALALFLASIASLFLGDFRWNNVSDLLQVWSIGLFLGVGLVFAFGPVLSLVSFSFSANPLIAYLASSLPAALAVSVVLAINFDSSGSPILENLRFWGLLATLNILITSITLAIFFLNKRLIDQRLKNVLAKLTISKSRFLNEFFDRLPLEKRGEIQEISIENKNLRIFTSAGSHTIRLSMQAALREFESKSGMLIHRKYWIRLDRIVELKYLDGNPVVFLSDGSMRPVSRKKVAAIRRFLDRSD